MLTASSVDYSNKMYQLLNCNQGRLQEFGLWYAHMMPKTGVEGWLQFDSNSKQTMDIYYIVYNLFIIYITLFIIGITLLMIGIIIYTYISKISYISFLALKITIS